MKSKKILVILSIIIIILLVCVINYITHKQYYNSDFNIKLCYSSIDKDGDGIDDQTDILESAKTYVSRKPIYKSKYYGTGYSNDKYGVCTDVVAVALLNSGYDIMELVNQDILQNQDEYNIEIVDKNIDFRRVKNLDTYFKHTAISLTTDITDIAAWQGGDIVVFEKHIGIVSDRRNKKGIPFVIHHANPLQISYEEDILEFHNDIVGHYRISM